MSKFLVYIGIVVIFNYFILNVLAGNEYYLISIRRNSNDISYHKATKDVQLEIDELVNDRMNDIYNIIVENKETFLNEKGEPDEKLKEVTRNSNLIKRTNAEISENKQYKFKFINENKDLRRNKSKLNKRKENNKPIVNVKENVVYIPHSSDLVKHVCPIQNYFVVGAYLSDKIIDQVKQLPNVIGIEKSSRKFKSYGVINNNSNYYNKDEILKETKWKGLGVQEVPTNIDFRYSHLSLLSQGKYSSNSNLNYDSNYYYPSTAGKGVDVYVIDEAFDVTLGEEEFDDYAGTSDKRTIRCAGRAADGKFKLAADNDFNLCDIGFDIDNKHGIYVAIAAVGKINGVAKKANLHMVSVKTEEYSNSISNLLSALEYIQQNGKPYKTVVNFSKNCGSYDNCFSTLIQNKVNDLNEKGILFFVPIGNESYNSCKYQMLNNNTFHIGAIDNFNSIEEYYNMDIVYRRASYSSYGECTDFFAPGKLRLYGQFIEGTSFSTPIAAGVAATIMSENSNTKYNYESMKKKLIELSLKNVIQGVDKNTPNRLLNNGKHLIYGHPRCDHSSGKYHCQDKSCTMYGVCVDVYDAWYTNAQEKCLIEKGCQANYGKCYSNKCGKKHNNNECLRGYCCSKDGDCKYPYYYDDGLCLIENGCQTEFGKCFANNYQTVIEKKETSSTPTTTNKKITTISAVKKSTTTVKKNATTAVIKNSSPAATNSATTTINVRFRGTMSTSQFYLGVNSLSTQNGFNIYDSSSSKNPTYSTWHITSKTSPSYLYLSKGTNGSVGKASDLCLDLSSTFVNDEGYNFLSIVPCSNAEHKFRYGGTSSGTIDIYDKNNGHVKDKNGNALCLYYSMTPRISRCSYIKDSSNKNYQHMKWDIYYL